MMKNVVYASDLAMRSLA